MILEKNNVVFVCVDILGHVSFSLFLDFLTVLFG